MSPKAVPGDPDFPYMMADTPEEFERVRRTPMTAPAEDPRGGEAEYAGHVGSCRIFYAERRCTCVGPAARPVGDRAQPTEELHAELVIFLHDYGAGQPWEAADALLAGPLAALLDAQAAVERVRADLNDLATSQDPADRLIARTLLHSLDGA